MGTSSARAARVDLLREVLVAAVVVARRRHSEDPTTVPPPLRPVVGMRKLTPRALAAADRAGDDEAFRAEVRAEVDPDAVGEAGRLWLDRAEGWSEALDARVAARAEAEEERDARRALAHERRGRERAEAARDEALAEVTRLRDALEALQARHDEREAALEEATVSAELARAERTRAVRELKGIEARHAQARDELREARAARDEALAAASAPTAADDDARPSGAPAPADQAGAPTSAPVPAVPAPEAARSDEPSFDRTAASGAVSAAAAAAEALAASLGELAATLGVGAPAPVRTAAPGPARRPSRRTGRPAPRRPIGRLPGGLLDDTPEAAEHLVRLPAAALLVDGYNASMGTWPGRRLAEQRERLVSLLDELEARIGVETTVVFDGVEETWSRSASRRVHVHFTPAGTEADDVILDLVDAIADARPVVVASDDRRVRDGARRRGAHVIGIPQLRALVG